MPAVIPSTKQLVNAMGIGNESKKELMKVLLAQNAMIRAIAAKLDADATVTDTNYAATIAAILKD